MFLSILTLIKNTTCGSQYRHNKKQLHLDIYQLKLNNNINTQLVESIYQVIQSFSDEERLLLEQKLFTNLPYPSQKEIISLAEASSVFNFFHDEPDIYSLEDREAV